MNNRALALCFLPLLSSSSASADDWKQEPVSAAGTELTALSPADPEESSGEVREQESQRKIRELEDRLQALEQERREREKETKYPRVSLGGYIQPQLLLQSGSGTVSNVVQASSLSPNASANDILPRPDGTTTNVNLFRLRRTRLHVEAWPSERVHASVVVDPLPLAGMPYLRDAEISGVVRYKKLVRAEFGAGLFSVPFGADAQEDSRTRPFLERSWWVNNLFPGQHDIGVRATGLVGDKLEVSLAVTNGVLSGEPGSALLADTYNGKDVWLRAKYTAMPLAFALSATYGQGQTSERGPAAEASPSLRRARFPRWAIGADASVRHMFYRPWGEFRLSLEGVLGQNEDRGVLYAFAAPAVSATNGEFIHLHEAGLTARLEHDLGRNLSAGARYDYYLPDTRFSGVRHTLAAVVSLHPSDALRFLAEYNHVADNVDTRGLPGSSRRLNLLSFTGQVSF